MAAMGGGTELAAALLRVLDESLHSVMSVGGARADYMAAGVLRVYVDAVVKMGTAAPAWAVNAAAERTAHVLAAANGAAVQTRAAAEAAIARLRAAGAGGVREF